MNAALEQSARKRAANAVRFFRKEFGVRTAPVNCFRVAMDLRDSGKIRFDWEEADGRLSSGFDARAQYLPQLDLYLVICRELPERWETVSARRRCNFTMAHELGHIFCGHVKIPKNCKSDATIALEDFEANAFAAELLMPREALGWFCSVQEAADGLLVSQTALRNRMRETGTLYALRTCPDCGFRRIPPAAAYCRECGRDLRETPAPPAETEVSYLPFPPKACPVCGYDFPAGRYGECLWCYNPKRNHCLPEDNAPEHWCRDEAKYCEVCGSPTLYAAL